MTESVSTAPTTGPLAAVRRHPLVAFFVLSYAVTWLLWSPAVFLGLPVFDPATKAPSWYLLPGIVLGVTGTAFVLTALTQGRPGLGRLLRRLTTWRVGLRWWAVAVLLLPLSQVVVAGVVLGSPDVLRVLTPGALLLYPASYAAHFCFGPLFEESGWRGFALPRMQHRFGPVRGSLLLGLLWSAWHFFLYAPLWFAAGPGSGVQALLVFTVLTTAMTCLFTWLSNHTRASLLLCILLHGSVDGTSTYLLRAGDAGVISRQAAANAAGMALVLACVLVAVVLLLVTRGRLGYPRYAREAEAWDVPAADRPTDAAADPSAAESASSPSTPSPAIAR